jgi:exopolysaccharide production protein ExoQ
VALALTSLLRSWSLAVDRPQSAPGQSLPYSATTLLPVLILTALLVQSLTESRLLDEYGLALLVLIAVKTKLPDAAPRPVTST